MIKTETESSLREMEPASRDNSISQTHHRRRLHWARYLVLGVLAVLVMSAVAWGLYQRRETVRQQLAEDCQRLRAGRNWEELRKFADKLARIEPDSAEPWIYKAAACEETNDFESMIAAIDRIPQSHPRFADFQVRKLQAEFRELNRPLDGLKTCDRLLELNPLVMPAHEESINFCLLTLQRAEMVRRIRRAINCRRERPEDYVFLATASWLNHVGIYAANSNWIKVNPCELFEVARAIPVYLAPRTTNENTERFADIAPIEQMINRYPLNLELLNYLIQKYTDYGNMKAVETLLERVPKTKDAESDARLWRARALCEDAKGDLQAAAENLQKAFLHDPYYWKVHYDLHQIYHRLGKQELADRFHNIYETGRPIAESVSFVNYHLFLEGKEKEISLANKKLLLPILKVALMVEDWAVVEAIRNRIQEAADR